MPPNLRRRHRSELIDPSRAQRWFRAGGPKLNNFACNRGIFVQILQKFTHPATFKLALRASIVFGKSARLSKILEIQRSPDVRLTRRTYCMPPCVRISPLCLAALISTYALSFSGPTLLAQTSTPAYPLRLSQTGTFIVDQNNKPYFINGDAGWELIMQVSNSDADLYLENRRAKGFNAVIMELIEHQFASNAPSNFYGDRPFLTPGDFSTPNEAYFAHADWVINDAASKGQLVLLAPLYLGFGCGSEGWCAEVKNSSLATIHNWGRYVGRRYAAFPNIVWVVGGDVDPVAAGVADKVLEFVAGLQETDNTHLMTAHNVRGQSAVAPAWTNASWISLNDVYTDSLTYTASIAEFNRTLARPFFLIESYYENEHSSTPLSLRSQAYWTVLSGLAGHLFGNCPIWSLGFAVSFCSPSNLTWQSQLDSAGSTTVALVGRLFNSRAFYALVPDQNHQVMTAGYQSGTTYAAAARTNDGSTVIAFVPTQRTITIDMTKIAGTSATAWWYNTRTGASTLVGNFPTTGPQSFTPPDANDWVLVADNTALALSAPGAQGNPPARPTNLRIIP